MIRFQFGTILMPVEIQVRGRYTPPAQEILGTNGRGIDVGSRTLQAMFSYNFLPIGMIQWWALGLLGNNLSREFAVSSVMVDQMGLELRPKSMIVHRPTFTAIRHNYRYENVVVRITDILL